MYSGQALSSIFYNGIKLRGVGIKSVERSPGSKRLATKVMQIGRVVYALTIFFRPYPLSNRVSVSVCPTNRQQPINRNQSIV